MPTYRVHVINDLANHEVLLVHCDSSKGDRPVAYISFQTDYTWDFKLHTFGHTRWRCHVAPDRYRSRYFRVFDENQTPNVDKEVFWSVREDGIYLLNNGEYVFTYTWENGTLSNVPHS
ncbi:hypothetical protein LINPERPRIM_LOCUS26876 [Linum perenne]